MRILRPRGGTRSARWLLLIPGANSYQVRRNHRLSQSVADRDRITWTSPGANARGRPFHVELDQFARSSATRKHTHTHTRLCAYTTHTHTHSAKQRKTASAFLWNRARAAVLHYIKLYVQPRLLCRTHRRGVAARKGLTIRVAASIYGP